MEDSTIEITHASVKTRIDNFIQGDLGHALEILCPLLEIARKDEDITDPMDYSVCEPILVFLPLLECVMICQFPLSFSFLSSLLCPENDVKLYQLCPYAS